jgi:hypothetical protein
VYRGRYWGRPLVGAKFLLTERTSDIAPTSWEVTGYRLLRQAPDGETVASKRLDTGRFSATAESVVEQLRSNPGVIARVNHVETIAGRIKKGALAAAALLTGAVVSYQVFGGDTELATNTLGQVGEFLGVATGVANAATEQVQTVLPAAVTV